MQQHEYNSVISAMHSHKKSLKNLKSPKPDGAINREQFNQLPVGTLIWLVWALGPCSYIKPGMTRKESSFDHKDHLGEVHAFDNKACFPYTDLTDDRYKNEAYRVYSKEYFDSYNLGPGAYNDSYVFLDEKLAQEYLAYCKTQPRYKSKEEEDQHKALMAEMDAISDRMTLDFIDDPQWDLEDKLYDYPED